MNSLQERIQNNKEYFKSMEIIQNTLIIKVQYGNRWSAYPSDDSENPLIKVAQSEEIPNEWYYYADVDKVDYNDIFNLIEQTIQMNLDMYAKVSLLKRKVEELKELFEKETLERLELLEFTIPNKKRKTKKKKTTEDTITNEETNLETVEVEQTC